MGPAGTAEAAGRPHGHPAAHPAGHVRRAAAKTAGMRGRRCRPRRRGVAVLAGAGRRRGGGKRPSDKCQATCPPQQRCDVKLTGRAEQNTANTTTSRKSTYQDATEPRTRSCQWS
jgi:hypothetical protein